MLNSSKGHIICILLVSFYLYNGSLFAQSNVEDYWHGIEREVRYQPENGTFVIQNGERRFNRALYGGHSGFRVEAGDLPEFAMYMPRLGGTLRFALESNGEYKWLIKADSIKAIYDPGKMMYEISDPILGEAKLYIELLALYDQEGMVFRYKLSKPKDDVHFVQIYGGASDERFSREGDIGADPESVFYLEPDNCEKNQFTLKDSTFTLTYLSKQKNSVDLKFISGQFPTSSILAVRDAFQLNDLNHLLSSQATTHPFLSAETELDENWQYVIIKKGPRQEHITDSKKTFEKCDLKRKEIASRIIINTPDTHVNNVAAALCIAADAIWEEPAFHHGSIAWRQQLVGWRGAYTADPLGWHDRGKMHFRAYASSQLTEPSSGPMTPDTSRNFARQVEKIGTAVFTEGYISRYPGGERLRAHHYDMNQVYIDALLRHFDWNGDVDFVEEMWPVIKRHLAWEKRNFDQDGNHLYDAYASFWASDAVQYSGGDVTHASAYHYYSNKRAAEIASLLGENPLPYQDEANAILNALNKELWVKEKGVFAEYMDLLGNQLVHDSPALWTIYHTIDSEVSSPLQSFLLTEYVNREIPHIPIKAVGLDRDDYYTLSTSNWMPYTWSVNNVALAELMHTSLAFWQAGRPNDAFLLWKSALMESMYLGASPGSIQQLSFYDAMRGELYRDFADPIGMTTRSLIEGLFGVKPKLLENKIFITPGFPSEWNNAYVKTPDFEYLFEKNPDSLSLYFKSDFAKEVKAIFNVSVSKPPKTVLINGEEVNWKFDPNSINQPGIIVESSVGSYFELTIKFKHPDSLPPDGKVQLPLIKKYNSEKNDLPKKLDDHQVESSSLLESKIINIETIDISSYYNEEITSIFKNQYLAPRPLSPTLQLPTTGIGNWCYPNVEVDIDDRGLKKKINKKGIFQLENGLQFKLAKKGPNIVFVSQWDNYPTNLNIPLNQSTDRIYLLMAGTTNPMQSRIVNGRVIAHYEDETTDTLNLSNPKNWWPIEQDYYLDGYAFYSDAAIPPRVRLKTGEVTTKLENYYSIKGYSNTGIEGGAATILEMPTDPVKNILYIELEAVANEVIIGLMGLTINKKRDE